MSEETIHAELKELDQRVDEHSVRLGILEQQQHNFEQASVEFLGRSAREEAGIHARLDEISGNVYRIPEMVSNKLAACQASVRKEVGENYAKKHEVVTPRALIIAMGLAASILVSGIGATVIIYDKINAVSHEINSE
jgi:hypothetical protein